MVKRWMAVAGLVLAVSGFASRGVSADEFADALNETMQPWREATWYSRTGNIGVASLGVDEFRGRWATFVARFETDPPPPYARDPAWKETLKRIAALAETAEAALANESTAEARAALAGIGAAMADLRRRNEVTDLADYVGRYREGVEAIDAMLSPDAQLDDAKRATLDAAARRIVAAVDELVKYAPQSGADDKVLLEMAEQNREGAAMLAAAVARKTPPSSALEIVGLIRVVRSNYNLLFLRYGADSHSLFLPAG
ncbi:MAG: hypothetical protein HY057_14525 [Rhodospirillales bacterium]|nr:hypothetical protein [Rhodospirillales bacterium]